MISPLFGVAGDRLGHRTVLSAMRAAYVLLSLCLAVLALTGQLNPLAVFVVAAFSGLVRPSDIGVRNALIAATVPRRSSPAPSGWSGSAWIPPG
ncbi:hypothetical protein ACFQU2_13240 [Siccirubricoccus deserti]